MDTPSFLDTTRPDVPNMVVSGGVLPFYLERSPVRGRLVRLASLADAILSRHDNPDELSHIGGEALALVAAMVSALKFKGALSLQIKGDGPVSMLVADATDTGDLRFFARLREDADRNALPPSTKELLGDGYMAFTIDQGPDMDRHQGIVDLSGETLADMAVNYFRTSEQHDCWIRLFCAKGADGWSAGALVLERIAAEGGIDNTAQDEDAWETACTLAATVTEQEILDPGLPNELLVHRLFGTLDVRLGTPRALAFGCRCSRARLASILATFPADDLDHMIEEGAITMNCEFCNVGFRFAREDVGERTS